MQVRLAALSFDFESNSLALFDTGTAILFFHKQWK
jgi:hypothetical protein